jgi:hypothetical protein
MPDITPRLQKCRQASEALRGVRGRQQQIEIIQRHITALFEGPNQVGEDHGRTENAQ